MNWNRREFLLAAGATAVAGRAGTLHALGGEANRLRWFQEAKFGMFIHWGPYSVAGVEASWPILRPKGEITEAEYRALPQRFNPVNFDPHAWVALAKSAGQRYMVFTTNHPAFRDTSKLTAVNYHGEPERPEWPLYLDYMGLQLDELLTRYGPVAEMWFDSVEVKVQDQYDGQRFIDQVHRLQPATLINNRLNIFADFSTPEQFIPKSIPVKGVRMDSQDRTSVDKLDGSVPKPEDFEPWEACMTINNSWSYKPKDRNFKSPDTLIRSLIEIISRGGNLLLDVGPQADGQIQPEFVERLKAIGEWTKLNSSAIYGSTYGPIQNQEPYRTTARGASVFVFVMDQSATEVKVGPINHPVHQVRLVATGKPLTFQASGKGIRVALDKAYWEHGIPVLELRY